MKHLKLFTVAIALVLGVQSFAQNNVFLNRDFWSPNTTIAQVDEKIKAGNNISELNNNSFDPVVFAINQEAPNETIKYIISKGGNDVNRLTHDSRTYIFWAAYKGNVEVMEYLLKKGAKTNILDSKGYTILNFAASAGVKNTKVYDICLANGANLKKDLNLDGANALLLVASSDTNFTLINYFTSKGLDINSVDANGNGIFNYVAKTGNIDLLKQLVAKGVKSNNQAFVFAAIGTRGKANGLEVYNYLESIGLNPNITTNEGVTPLQIVASRNKDISVINYFIEKGLDVNTPDNIGNTAFLNAANSNSLEVVKHLASFNKNINAQNKKGETALMLAVERNSPEVVSYLLDNKANAQLLDAEGNNAAYYLVNAYTSRDKGNFEKKAQILNAHQVNFSAKQAKENTLYHVAIDKQDLELLKYLEAYNIDINAVNVDGLSVLHMAAMKAKDDVILKYLIAKGADKKTVTGFDESVFDLASENELLAANRVDINFLK
ncbi:ankyrin repeat domain-containing protein [Mariniflexile jejuense]|uniref:Ankyrin repeat domain-containing protein n=1 Tax=Mariniflexile jejuense TaxID=1173582 RepID=A0ABW3JLA9_9FLAO